MLLGLLKDGDSLIIQDKLNSNNNQKWEISGNPVVIPNDYVTFPVVLVSGTHSFSNNDAILLIAASVGTPGPQGPAGPAGADGAQGPVGPTGPAGPAGADGAQGPIGPEGPAGPTGPAGPQGIDGPQGPQGLQGEVGPTGPQGPAGADGAQGPAGPQGDAGATGAEGPQGPQGIQGIQGPQGEIGPTGPVGPAGADGATGPAGPAGPQGEPGPTGPEGLQGIQGIQGVQGIQGEVGATGAQGPQGIQGPQGEVGPIGPEGPVGPTGPVGGSDTQIIYNNAGAPAGSADLTWTEAERTMRVGSILLDASLNTIKVDAPADAGLVEIVDNAAATRSRLAAGYLDMLTGADTKVILDATTSVPSFALAELLTTNEVSLNPSQVMVMAGPANNAALTASSLLIGAPGAVIDADVSVPRVSVGDGLGTEAALWNGYATASLPPTAADQLTRKDYVDGLVSSVSTVASFRPTNMYYVAKNGSDISGNGSYLNPWLTIQNAINVLEAIPVSDQTQAVINLAPGHYTENVTFTKGYIALISPYNINDVNEGCEITGNVTVNITTGTDDLYNKQVVLQGVQVTGTITDTSTKAHTIILQDCYIFGANQCFHQNTAAGVDVRTRLYNCEINDSTNTGSTNPMIRISRGDAYLERLDCSYRNNGNVLRVDGTGAVFASYCNFVSETSLSSPTSPAGSGVRVVWVISSRASTFGLCTFQFSNSATKTNADNFWLFRYDAPSFPGAGMSLGFCSFAPAGMNSGQSVAGSNGGTGNPALIAYGNCLATPGGASTIAGTLGINKIAFTAVA